MAITYLSVDERDAENVREVENDMVLLVLALGGGNVALDAGDLLDLAWMRKIV